MHHFYILLGVKSPAINAPFERTHILLGVKSPAINAPFPYTTGCRIACSECGAPFLYTTMSVKSPAVNAPFPYTTGCRMGAPFLYTTGCKIACGECTIFLYTTTMRDVCMGAGSGACLLPRVPLTVKSPALLCVSLWNFYNLLPSIPPHTHTHPHPTPCAPHATPRTFTRGLRAPRDNWLQDGK